MITILGEDLNYDREQAFKMACGLGSGISRWGTVCGAVSGGVMALGFCFGPTKNGEKEKKDKTYVKVQEMLRAFEQDFGTVQCRQLTGLNFMDPVEREQFKIRDLYGQCAEYIANIVESVRKAIKEK